MVFINYVENKFWLIETQSKGIGEVETNNKEILEESANGDEFDYRKEEVSQIKSSQRRDLGKIVCFPRSF